jgi:hypothetical protein
LLNFDYNKMFIIYLSGQIFVASGQILIAS